MKNCHIRLSPIHCHYLHQNANHHVLDHHHHHHHEEEEEAHETKQERQITIEKKIKVKPRIV
jgi:hypothetical protein